ncbi:helix-turn-helix domain-containing protein [Rhodococcus sp. NPDC019627]|uniref:helix-turn-helix domain-containing protein n=1 Tax=unclassified Rhodococcus (in: high G+C Gram-positive bacteria) TaxID=192944 RepID=UPI00340F4924
MRPPLNGFQPRALEVARTAAGLSRGALSRALGVDPSTIHKWETSRSHPEPEHLTRITETLGIPLDRLLVVPRNRQVLADLRILAGLTQRQVANRAGISTTTIGKIERGEASLSDRHAAALADVLCVDERTIRAAYLRNRPLPQSP